MKKGVIIIDFDNVFYGKDSSSGIKCYIESFIETCISVSRNIETLDIRLYGGWKTNANYTNQASKVLGFLETIKSELFPYIIDQTHRLFGNLELATSQHNLDIEWENTFHEKNAKHFLSVKTDNSRYCNHKQEECPIQIVAKATRGAQVLCPIDGCEYIDVSQLVRMEQKMVDSMMTCDILEYVHDDDCEVIIVVSDDIDLHPALALAGERYAKKNAVKLVLMVKNQKQIEKYKHVLTPHNVIIKTW